MPGDKGDLKSSPQSKKDAVSALNGLEQDLKTDGSWADNSTHDAVDTLKGWDTGTGLKDALTEWGQQVTALRNRLLGEQTALGNTNTLFVGNDGDTSGQFSIQPRIPLSPQAQYPPLVLNPDPTSKLSDY
ncbi:hypothetical protein [Streptantibioticus ferralitis]|uniref:Uncharacterized protein n=1 Tax=Streptantibioticus ferralitis TaxID=236510 RepID=A0ABT5ZA92_9ACTN|nr:hypothetical protein [Streptantibioticus ferralitis]MDF2260756.1 hypothetical protein [Streptantibioticus ferralitis]